LNHIEDIEKKMYEWVELQAAMGPRRPGSPPGHRNEDFLAEKLREFKLERVRKEPIPITCWSGEESGLEIGEGDNISPIDHFYVPYTRHTPDSGISAPLFYIDPKTVRIPAKCRGKIVVTDISFSEIRREDAKINRLFMKLLKRISRGKATFWGLRPVY